jgi:hypothetical protein
VPAPTPWLPRERARAAAQQLGAATGGSSSSSPLALGSGDRDWERKWEEAWEEDSGERDEVVGGIYE